MGQSKRKKSKRGSSSSEAKKVMAASQAMAAKACDNELKNSMDCLRQVGSEGFVKLHTYLDKLRFEFKTEIDAVKLSIKGHEENLTYTQSEVEDLKGHFGLETKEHSKEVDTLNKKIADMEDRLKQEFENNTRRENLRFNNIEKKEREDCKAVVYNILEKELGVDTTKIRFHAVHRVCKKIHDMRTPIIARFICNAQRSHVSVMGYCK